MNLNTWGNFQICISVPLGAAYYIEELSYQDMLHFVYLTLSVFWSVYVLFKHLFFFIIISILISNNHIILLTWKNLFFWIMFAKVRPQGVA